MRPIYNIHTNEQSGVAIFNKRIDGTRQFCVTLKTLAMFQSPAECYDYLMDGFRSRLLPRSGNNEGRPLSPRSIELFERNKKLGFRHWVWLQKQPGRHVAGWDYVYGYGYETENGGFVIVNNDDTIFIEVGGKK